MYFVDTETCGFHGVPVLIQYADGKHGKVHKHNIWHEPAIETLELIETIANEGIVGFNLAFDWFHLQKIYNMLEMFVDRKDGQEIPIDHIDFLAELEPLARDGRCVKPAHALDLMLHARKGPYQSTMDRKNIRIKRVPIRIASLLVEELNKRIPLKDIYFARQQDPKKRWDIIPIPDDTDFVHVELKFKPSSALKVLVQDALGKNQNDILRFGDIAVPKRFNPMEVGWAPFALAVSSPDKDWKVTVKKNGATKIGYAWPRVVRQHIAHWAFDEKAKKYADADVLYLQELIDYFGNPEPDDDDSVLACMAGSVRWRGFAVDMEKVDSLLADAIRREKAAPKDPKRVKHYLMEVMDETEKQIIEASSKKTVLEAIGKWEADCPDCGGTGCEKCTNGAVKHPAAIRATACLNARKAKFDQTLFLKLKQAGRFHVSAKVLGSLSGRMTSGDGLNALGITHLKEVRKAFTLAFGDLVLCGGDFSAYEVSIADADYNDPELRKQLLTCYVCKETRSVSEFDDLFCPKCGRAECKCKNCKGTMYAYADGRTECKCGNPSAPSGLEVTLRKLHGLFGQELEPGLSYEDVLATKGTANDLYDKGKKGGFSKFYGGTWQTLVQRLGVEEEVAKRADIGFDMRYQGVGAAKKRNEDDFCSMRQPGGIGTAVIWNEPKDYAESLNGFKRYFTLENAICRALFDLANDPPPHWSKIGGVVVRRDNRQQKIHGAAKSAVFGAAFQIQAKNMRAAQNHRIQATGAIETKRLQARIWRLQPSGVAKWVVQPFNIHDELLTPVLPSVKPALIKIIRDFVLERRSLIPLLKMDFVEEMKTWADKG